MKKRKFNDGGEFKLSEEALASGLRIGKNERISDEDRAAAMKNSESIVDKYRDFDKNPEAKAIPVDIGQRSSPRATPRDTPRATPRARAVDAGNPDAYTPPMSTIEGNPDAYTPPKSTVERRFPQRTDFMGDPTSNPKRGSYDQPGPIGGAFDAIKEMMGKTPRARAAAKRALQRKDPIGSMPMKKGGSVQASKRGDGIAQRGKTKGRLL
jgi:hypothetical protein